ncbi:ribose 5-phosphate isomerase [Escherichia coli]|nr:ribose 5-phosphate isomerase [Escherichia coli]
MQPMFLFKKSTGAMGGHVAGTAGFRVAVPALYLWSMSEGIDKEPGRQSALIIRITPVKLHWLLVHEWLASNWQK